jgi:2-polyprenyl-3-methyl-5-hydroxy-6-metoxy-1,4-benzoquinol methylase
VHFDRRVRLAMTVSGLRGGRAVDVGCATGAMAAALSRHGFVAHGVDLSPYCVREAEARHTTATFAVGTVSDVDGPVELVTYLDVLEHVSDPRAELAAVHRLLARGGVLLLELPNQASADAEVLGTDYLFPEHLYFHVPDGIRRLLDSCGFDVLDVRTVHDSYFRVQDVVGEPYAGELAEAGRGERLLVVARRR